MRPDVTAFEHTNPGKLKEGIPVLAGRVIKNNMFGNSFCRLDFSREDLPG